MIDIYLKACPFCAGAARIESNRDWHRLWADHSEDCIFDADEADLMYPATPKHLAQLAEDWNRRAAIPAAPAAPEGQAEAILQVHSVLFQNAWHDVTRAEYDRCAANHAVVRTVFAAVPRQAAVGEVQPVQAVPDAPLQVIREAVKRYYEALSAREHGGVAQDRGWRSVEAALGMDWDSWRKAKSALPGEPAQ
jgi:hypothetical protein